jgi:hypothetical protein
MGTEPHDEVAADGLMTETVVSEHEGIAWLVSVTFEESSGAISKYSIEPVHGGPIDPATIERATRDLSLAGVVEAARRSSRRRSGRHVGIALAGVIHGMLLANIIEPDDPRLHRRLVRAYERAQRSGDEYAIRSALEDLEGLRYAVVRPGDPPDPRRAVRPWPTQLNGIPTAHSDDRRAKGRPPWSPAFLDECAIVLEAIDQLGPGVPKTLAFRRYVESRTGRVLEDDDHTSLKELKRRARPAREEIRAIAVTKTQVPGLPLRGRPGGR